MKPPRTPPRIAPSPPRGAAQAVRIIGGQWKRTPLPVAAVAGLRPTPNRVRETLFNWLGQDMSGRDCLDLFAGTGALGLEAASRGARHVLLFETQASAVRALHAVIARLHAEAQCEVRQGDALHLAARFPPRSLDVIFIDPPFDAALHGLAARCCAPLLREGGRLYVEAPDDATLTQVEESGFIPIRRARAGAVSFALFAAAGEENQA